MNKAYEHDSCEELFELLGRITAADVYRTFGNEYFRICEDCAKNVLEPQPYDYELVKK